MWSHWPKHIAKMIRLITVIALVMVNHMLSNVPWFRLPNPGICFPLVGHIHKIFTKEMVADPVKGLRDMYRKHQRNGVMWTRNFNMDILMEVTTTTMIGLITVIALVMVNHVLSNVPWFRFPNPGICFPWPHPQVLHKGDGGGSCQGPSGYVQEAPEEWGDVDEELQHGHSVGRRLWHPSPPLQSSTSAEQDEPKAAHVEWIGEKAPGWSKRPAK